MSEPAARMEPRRPARTQRAFLDGIASDLEPGLRALPYVVGAFFAGSAANDELLVDGRGAGRLLSDVEIGIVSTRPWNKREVRRVVAAVGEAHGAEIDAFLVTRARLRKGLHKNVGIATAHASVFAYEISQAARWIYGRGVVDCKEWRPADIHPWEGVRLVLNRLGEGAPWLAPSANGTANRSRWSIKTLIASGDALLLSIGQFAPSYAGRARLWAAHAPTLLDEAATRAAVTNAYRARAEDLGAEFEIDDAVWVAAARAATRAGLAASGFAASSPAPVPDSRALRLFLTDARLPTLHTLAGGRIDAAFDSALRLPRLRNPRVRTMAVLADWRGRGCLQHWAYVPLLAGLREATSDGAYAAARAAIAPYFSSSAESDRECVRDWWRVMCK